MQGFDGYLATVVERITDAFFALDDEWRFVYLNREAERVLFRSRENLLGKNVWEEFPEAVGLEFYEEYHKAMAEQVTVEFEEYYPPLETWFEAKAYPSETGLSVYFRDVTERKRAEEALKESEARYARIATNVPGMVYQFVLHPDGSVSFPYLSEGSREVYGLEPKEIQQDPAIVIDVIHPEDRPGFDRSVEASAATLSPWEWEGRVTLRSGEQKWLRATSRPQRQANGDVLWDGLLMDVTARKRAEEALRESERRLHAVLVQYGSDVIMILDAEGTIRYQSPAVERMLGYRPEELVGDRGLDYLHPEDIERASEELGRIMDEPGLHEPVEYRFRHKDGSWRYLEGIGNNLLDDPAVRGVVIASRDITERKRAEEALKESEERFRTVVQSLGEGLIITDVENTILHVNSRMTELMGYAAEEQLVGEFAHELLLPRERWREAFLDWNEKRLWGVDNRHEIQLARKDGTLFWSEITATPYRNAAGEVVGSVRTIVDITERKQDEEERARQVCQAALRADVGAALAESADLDGLLQECAGSVVRHLDAAFARIWVLNEYEDVLELRASAGIYTHLDGPHSRVHVGRFKIGLIARERRPLLTNDILNNPRISDKEWAKREGMVAFAGYPLIVEGRLVGVMAMFAREPLEEDTLGALASVADAIAQGMERKILEEQLKHRAFHDTLTDLPNRALFVDRLEHALSRTERREGKTVAVLFIDLDNFKFVNDTLGHHVGDELLVAVSARLRNCLRPADTAARLGGDEFAVLLEDVEDMGEAERVAERIIAELRAPFVLGGQEVYVTPSIGITLGGPAQDPPENLLREADVAMYRAKGEGKARHSVFDPGMEAQVVERLGLENDLRRALERDEFEVRYQPIVGVDSGRIFGMEALVRWQHPERGLTGPDEFVPLAEETGMIVPIGQRVLEEACRQAKEWQERYPAEPPLMIGVNLSARQLRYPGLVEDVEGALQESGLDAQSLTLEITESAVVRDEEHSMDTLPRLRGMGVRFALDDFGTGYSSLSYLKRLPVGLLKVDGSFVERLGKEPEDEVLLSGVIGIASGLGLYVLAEGVETPDQLACLRSMGCELAQGDYFSRPLSTEAMGELLDRMQQGPDPERS